MDALSLTVLYPPSVGLPGLVTLEAGRKPPVSPAMRLACGPSLDNARCRALRCAEPVSPSAPGLGALATGSGFLGSAGLGGDPMGRLSVKFNHRLIDIGYMKVVPTLICEIR